MGFAPGTFPGTFSDFLSLVHPDSLPVLKEAQKKALESDGRYEAELKFQLRDGRFRWGRTRGQIVFDEKNRPARVVGVEVDITERKQAEEALSQARDWYTKVAATLPGAIISFHLTADRKPGFSYCSPEIRDFYGLTPEELMEDACRMKDVIHPDDRERLKQSALRSAETLEIWHEEFRLRHPQRGEIWVEARSIPQAEPDGGTLWVGILLDITERIKAQTALKASEELYRRLLDVIPDAVFIAAKGSIVYCNQMMLKLVGASSSDQLLKLDPLKLFEPASQQLIQQRVEQMLKSAESAEQIEERILTLHGSSVPVEIVATSVTYKGKPSILVAIHDLSQRRDIEEELRQAQKMEAVGRLAGGVAHDFNNLLTVILGYSEMLLESIPASHPAYAQISEIQSAGQRAAGLTRQLLTFSRRQVLKPVVVDLNKVVINAMELLKRMIGEDIAVTTSLSPEPLMVRVDPPQMDQVLLNIAANARDAMPRGGRLTISTGQFEAVLSESGKTAARRPGLYAVLSITDSGHGISDEVRARVFDPFFTTKAPGQGSGLGLSVVHGIVKQSDGYVEISSEPDKSTTVDVLLPICPDQPEEPGLSSVFAETPRGSETLLLVEDEAAVRDVAVRALSAAGYTVLTASDGMEALRTCRMHEGPIDLLATDVVLPVISGRTVAEMIQKQYPDTKVLFISGYTDEAVLRHGVQLKEVAYLQKPYTPDGLCQKVRDVLDSD